MKKYGLDEPIFGVLFKSGKHSNSDLLNYDKYYFIEMELAFVLENSIEQKLESIEELLPNIRYFMPAIELPIINFGSKENLKAIDVVAANSCSSDFILGYPLKPEDIDFNIIKADLYHNGELIDSGESSAALGNQLEALLWLVNKALSEGYSLEKGHILITGVIGKLNEVKKGYYQAVYSDIGRENKVKLVVE